MDSQNSNKQNSYTVKLEVSTQLLVEDSVKSRHVRQPTRVLPVTQTSHEKETVDAGPSQSHQAIWGLQAGRPVPDKTHGGHCEVSLLHSDSILGNGISI